jgi:hypothetical protein
MNPKESKKLEARDVFTIESATPKFLRWSNVPVTFDRSNHPNHVPCLWRYPLILNPKMEFKTRPNSH